jgi:hypothetical protein
MSKSEHKQLLGSAIDNTSGANPTVVKQNCRRTGGKCNWKENSRGSSLEEGVRD